jgi:hypothetical protein
VGIYDDLGVPRVINAQATLTRLGGSRMPDEVVAAMEDAAGAFVDLVEFQNRVCEEIARLTNNEAAWITSGAAAGITQSVAACIAGNDPALIDGFPYLEHGGKSEVIVFRSQRNGYDYAARQTGARLIEIGTDESELAAAISPRTSSILWFAGSHYADGALPIEEVVDIARARGFQPLAFHPRCRSRHRHLQRRQGIAWPAIQRSGAWQEGTGRCLPGQRQPELKHRPADESRQGRDRRSAGSGQVVARPG